MLSIAACAPKGKYEAVRSADRAHAEITQRAREDDGGLARLRSQSAEAESGRPRVDRGRRAELLGSAARLKSAAPVAETPSRGRDSNATDFRQRARTARRWPPPPQSALKVRRSKACLGGKPRMRGAQKAWGRTPPRVDEVLARLGAPLTRRSSRSSGRDGHSEQREIGLYSPRPGQFRRTIATRGAQVTLTRHASSRQSIEDAVNAVWAAPGVNEVVE